MRPGSLKGVEQLVLMDGCVVGECVGPDEVHDDHDVRTDGVSNFWSRPFSEIVLPLKIAAIIFRSL